MLGYELHVFDSFEGVPGISPDEACIVSQDSSKGAVRRLLENPVFWYMFDRGVPVLTCLTRTLVSIHFQTPTIKEAEIIIYG